MSHVSTIFSQILKFVPRHEFTSMEKEHDRPRRKGAMTRWTQFVAMSAAQLTGRSSLRDIESTLSRQEHLKYHLGNSSVKKSTLSRANQTLTADFSKAYLENCMLAVNKHLRHISFDLRESYFRWMHRCLMSLLRYFRMRTTIK